VKITLTFASDGAGYKNIVAREDDGPLLQVGRCTRHTSMGSDRLRWTASLHKHGGSSGILARITRDTAAGMEQAVRENGRWWQ
jgi:hypothetical protein